MDPESEANSSTETTLLHPDVDEEKQGTEYKQGRNFPKAAKWTIGGIAVSVVIVMAVGMAVGIGVTTASGRDVSSDPYKRAVAFLNDYPVVDGYVRTCACSS